MPAGPRRRSRVGSLLLLIFSPLWAPIFLLAQAILLCADGIVQICEEIRGGRVLRVSRGARWLIGIPGLALFPLLVGLRAIGGLALGLGRWLLRGFGWRGRGRALPLIVGIIAAPLLPLWLPLAAVVWIVRWVLWRLLIPEFSHAMHPGGSRDERLVTFVGLRYLFSRRETALHSATNYFAAGGIALGVCALIVVLAVMSGFDKEVRERIVGTNAHVIILRYGPQGLANADSLMTVVAGDPQVQATSPFVFGKAMISAGQSAEGAMVKGVDWDREKSTTSLASYVDTPGLGAALSGGGGRLPGIIVGRYIADNLGLMRGDEVVLISPAEARRTPLGYVPRMRRFQVVGTFNSGMYDFDANMAFIDLAQAQSFFDLGQRVSGIEVRIADMNRAPQVADELVDRLGGFPYRANNWIDLNSNLFAWMRTEKRAMFVILTMIVLVAGFNIASSLIMLVTEKRREIGILKSMGTTAMGILRIFVLEGWVIALAGTGVGVATGLGLCEILERYRLIRLPEDIYFIDTLPVRVEWGDVWAIIVSVLAIAALATLYPAWRAARLDPVEAIRAE